MIILIFVLNVQKAKILIFLIFIQITVTRDKTSLENIIRFELKIVVFSRLPTVVRGINKLFNKLFHLNHQVSTFYCFFGSFFKKFSILKSLKQRIYLCLTPNIFNFQISSSLHSSIFVKCWTIRD